MVRRGYADPWAISEEYSWCRLFYKDANAGYHQYLEHQTVHLVAIFQ
jgi:hypothetical protein